MVIKTGTGPVLSIELLDLLHIKEGEQERFCSAISHLVLMAQPGYSPFEYRAGKIAAPFKRISKLARQLHLALREADADGDANAAGVHALLDTKIKERSSTHFEADHVSLHRKQIAELLEASEASIDWTEANVKSKGQPSGVRGYPSLAHFIALLVARITAAGGRVNIDKRTDTGSLIVLLEELRASLPSGFMPSAEQHPSSTYDRIAKRAVDDWYALRPNMR